MIRKIAAIFVTAILVATAGAYVLWQELQTWALTSRQPPSEVIYSFEPGTSLEQLALGLEQRGVIDSALRFRLWIKVSADYRRFQAGKYRFPAEQDISPQTVINQITTGDVYHPIVMTVTIPEGFTIKQVAARLAAHGVGAEKQILAKLRSRRYAQRWKIGGTTLEGFLYPATYSYIKQPDLDTVIKNMIDTFWENLPPQYEEHSRKRGLSLYEAVCFASLIETETKYREEMPFISEVIWRRLKKGEPLAIDAAVIYGIKDYRGDIKWSHLKDAKNVYNTRIHKGLPPTPIGAVSRAALEAVLTPSNRGYYYYVLKVGSDKHHFSKTLAEHNRYVKQLVRASRRKERR